MIITSQCNKCRAKSNDNEFKCKGYKSSDVKMICIKGIGT
jgi:hypothetical protein